MKPEKMKRTVTAFTSVCLEHCNACAAPPHGICNVLGANLGPEVV
jgi:hypothetical protein